MLRPHPHMLNLSERARHHERAATGNLFVSHSNKDFVFCDELGCDGQVELPLLNPVRRVVPMAFRGVRNGREHCSLMGLCPANLNIHSGESNTTFRSNPTAKGYVFDL